MRVSWADLEGCSYEMGSHKWLYTDGEKTAEIYLRKISERNQLSRH
jgi:hypothetical protein